MSNRNPNVHMTNTYAPASCPRSCASNQGSDGKWNKFGGRLAWDASAICSNNPAFGGRGNPKQGDDYAAAPNIDHTQERIRNVRLRGRGGLGAPGGYGRCEFCMGPAPGASGPVTRKAATPRCGGAQRGARLPCSAQTSRRQSAGKRSSSCPTVSASRAPLRGSHGPHDPGIDFHVTPLRYAVPLPYLPSAHTNTPVTRSVP